MNQLLSIGILPVVITLIAYEIGLICQKKLKSPIFNPILIAVILVLGYLTLTGTPYAQYKQGMGQISWLMTPATVCLAIPMYEQIQILRKNFPMMVVGILSGSVACIVMVFLFAALFGFDAALTASLLPKSVTSAIGVPLSEMIGGLGSITTPAIILTGIFASILGTTFCKLFRITHPVAQGVAFGTAGHVIGTAKANELGELIGAASSLSLVVAGLLTALILPMLTSFI